MVVMCQCRFIVVTNVPAPVGDVEMGKAMHVWGQGMYGKSLLLHTAVNVKLL